MLKTLAICHIIISSGTNGNWQEKYWHEVAHCNGWVHPHKDSATGEAYQPPRKYLYPYLGPLDFKLLPVKEAEIECQKVLGNKHFACYWID